MRYNGTARSITPNTANDNYSLDGTAAASKPFHIKEVTATGEATSSTAMCTRFNRSSGQTGAGTAGNVAKVVVDAPTNGISFYSNAGGATYASTQPTLAAGDLFAGSWNAYGGLLRMLLAPEEWWWFCNGTLSGRNSVGVGVSSYTVVWEEV